MRTSVVVVDRDPIILSLFQEFLSRKGYDALLLHEPAFCEMYGNPFRECEGGCCADILIMEHTISNIELLQKQAVDGCRMERGNKAMLSLFPIGAKANANSWLGCEWFEKPFLLGEIAAWLEKCETRLQKCEG
ncbi:MAG: hypothetical protein FIA94_01895 [Nitrospirae bacterium]|nr:hypothetical protein [Nitrospirota bacterium]